MTTRGHGSPEDRGSMDAYYNRPFNPHSKFGGVVVKLTQGSSDWHDYNHGFDNEDDRKEW